MPTLAAPGLLLAAVAAAAVVVGLHLLAWRRPAPRILPTARFAPRSAARAVSRAMTLNDAALLVVRVAVLLLAGLAMAGPSLAPRRGGVARVLVLDASRRVADVREVADSARALAPGARTIVRIRVDSVARLLTDSALGARAAVRGLLGAGLVAAVREGNRLARTHDRVDVVVISPFAAESWDESVEAVRGRWSGAMRAVRVAAARVEATSGEGPRDGEAPAVPLDADRRASGASPQVPPPTDPVGAALALAVAPNAPALRVIRALPAPGDSAFARGGGVVLAWPDASLPDSAFTSRALVAGERTVVARLAPTNSPLPPGRVVARWGDGGPAAVEQAIGRGCLRTVAVAVPRAGDAVLRPAFLGVVRELVSPCGGGSAALVDSARLTRWAMGNSAPSSAAGSAPLGDRPSREAQRWLLVAVALLLAGEWWLRRARVAAVEGRFPPATAREEAA